MFLKRLTCQGFKSFADKIEFDFPPGITGVVGPNGCGKSNIVDAIKWVLGDQSAKSLRGEQMQDVIFSGSGTRKAAGMAQVDLLFENSDRRLPSDTDEVKVTRRLYRTGESEYLLNNQAVRLKDIKELFLDTGIGVSAYSVIEQNKVTYLIQANPAQRRAVFEEAAGISRYKARKVEAQRKLQRVDQNLLRIEDVVEELEKRLRSIKYQAGKARNFQVYDQQLREKRATYALAEYHRLSERAADLTEQARAFQDDVTRLRTAISSAEAQESQWRTELDGLDAQRQELQRQVLANAAEMTEKRERAQQSRQQVEMLSKVRLRELERLAGERQKLLRLEQQLQEVEGAAQALDRRLEAAHAVEDSLTAEDGVLGRELASLESRVEEGKIAIVEVLRRTAQVNNEIESLTREQHRLEGEGERLRERQRQVESELAELATARAAHDERATELADLIRRQTLELEQKQEAATQLDANQAELSRQLAAAKEHRSGMLSRKQTLVDLDRKHEGVDAGIRELLHRKEQDSTGRAFPYVWGMVADLIAADVSSAVLIETALGEFDQYLVVEDSRALLADAQMLADFPGRIPTLCLDLLPPFVNGRDFTQQEGFVAYAMSLVRYPAAGERLVRHLLGRTIIVRSMEDALRMAKQNPPIYRYVTLSGQLLDPLGICQLGPAGTRTGLISRKSELREIDSQIAEVEQRITSMTERLAQTSAEAAAIQRRQQELRNARADARTAEAENNAARNATQSAIDRLRRVQPEIASDLHSVDTRMADAQRRVEQNRVVLLELEQAGEHGRQEVANLQQKVEGAKARRQEVAQRLTRAKIEAAELGQQRSMLSDRSRALRTGRQGCEEAVRAAAFEAQQARERSTQAERSVLNAQTRLADLYAEKEHLDGQVLTSSRHREEIAVRIEQLAGEMKDDRSRLEQAEVDLTARQMDLRECRIRTEELLSRIRDELDVDLQQAYAGYEHQELDWSAVEAEINDLKDKIRRLGNVNLDAIAEQEELEQREGFLTTQRDDLRSAKSQLEELIEELNRQCRERFTQTFETVRGHFNEMFRRLFGGGKADVFFEPAPEGQPLDVLEAGIEIQAQPPGKELRTNSLLSGGEKTMTAIALLMAIFKSRPSPFTLLDEVDAALDEANNERFNRIVGEFLEHTQFIIITHQKPTMSIADVLYGITMQEAGVSKRVSVKFETAAVA
ncbi:MAG: chromosome segregation protein SMC [Phycisphaerae bacterium]|nr:chromosome segregation protein SMC [Phycisphaerae bacterium]